MANTRKHQLKKAQDKGASKLEQTQACSLCKEDKIISQDFYKDPRGRNGVAARCKPCCIGKNREWLANQTPEARKRYRDNARNVERDRISSRNWRRANPEKTKQYYEMHHKPNSARYSKTFYSSDRGKTIKRNSDLKRQLRTTDQYVEHIDAFVVTEMDDGMCQICYQDIDLNSGELTVDHIIPLSKGGVHAYYNVQLAHRGCNSKKGAMINE